MTKTPSKIEKLITKLCPHGVEFKELGSVCNLYIGTFVKKTEQSNDFDYPVYNGGTTPTGYFNKFNSEKNSVVISARGSIGFVNFVTYNFWAGNSCYVLKNVDKAISAKYLYFILKANEAGVYRLRQTGGIPAINSAPLSKFKIPVPPLAVQEEIVKILNSFTELEAELEAEREAELEARRKQYEHYRSELLTFSEQGGVRWMALGEVCDMAKTIKWSENRQSQFQYIDLSSVDREKHMITDTQMIDIENAPSRAQKIVKTGDIIFGTTRPTLGRFCVITDQYDGQICSTGFCVLRPKKDEILTNYVYHQLGLKRFLKYVEDTQRGASYPAISDNDVKKYKITVPPLAEQKRIAAILDKFDALVNDISIGLSAEIAARSTQYEHYRNRLLTFKEYAG